MNVLAYADDIVLIGKNEIEIRKLFVEMENISRKFWITNKPKRDKINDSGKEKQFKEN